MAKRKAGRKGPAKPKPHKGAKAKTPTGPFSIVDHGCTLKRVSLGSENHGDEPVRTATLSIEGVRWLKEQVDQYFGPYTWTKFFDTQAATKLEEPSSFFKHSGGTWPVEDKFKVNSVDLKSSNKTFKFRAQEHSDGEGQTPAGNVKSIVFSPMPGGYMLVSFHLTVRPQLGEFDELVDAWGGPIKLTLGDVTAEAKDTSKQVELPLPPGGESQSDAVFG